MLNEAEQQVIKAAEALQAAKVRKKRKVDEVDGEDEEPQPQAKRRTWPARGKRRGHHSTPAESLTAEDEERMRGAEDNADRVRRYDRLGARGYVSRTRPDRSVDVIGVNIADEGGDGAGEPNLRKEPRRSTKTLLAASAGKARQA